MKIQKISSSHMLFELLTGIAIYSIICEAVILIFTKEKLFETIGLIAGVLVAVSMVIHMAYTIEKSVSMTEEEALKATRISYILRYAVLIVVFLLLFFLKLGDVVSALFGVFSLKVAAFLQPITHKAVKKSMDKGR